MTHNWIITTYKREAHILLVFRRCKNCGLEQEVMQRGAEADMFAVLRGDNPVPGWPETGPCVPSPKTENEAEESHVNRTMD